MHESSKNNPEAWSFTFLAWLVACVSTLGSLFFSEVMKYPPCALCWYQRILMYPLTIILLQGLFPFDAKVVKFAQPLIVVGWLISFYHNLLYYEVLPESAAPCVQGASCTDVHFEYIGIPLMSLIAFTLLAILLQLTKRSFHAK